VVQLASTLYTATARYARNSDRNTKNCTPCQHTNTANRISSRYSSTRTVFSFHKCFSPGSTRQHQPHKCNSNLDECSLGSTRHHTHTHTHLLWRNRVGQSANGPNGLKQTSQTIQTHIHTSPASTGMPWQSCPTSR
jgi:hypothetical protein